MWRLQPNKKRFELTSNTPLAVRSDNTWLPPMVTVWNSPTAVLKFSGGATQADFYSQKGYSQRILFADVKTDKIIGTIEISATGSFMVKCGTNNATVNKKWPALWHSQTAGIIGLARSTSITVRDCLSNMTGQIKWTNGNRYWYIPMEMRASSVAHDVESDESNSEEDETEPSEKPTSTKSYVQRHSTASEPLNRGKNAKPSEINTTYQEEKEEDDAYGGVAQAQMMVQNPYNLAPHQPRIDWPTTSSRQSETSGKGEVDRNEISQSKRPANTSVERYATDSEMGEQTTAAAEFEWRTESGALRPWVRDIDDWNDIIWLDQYVTKPLWAHATPGGRFWAHKSKRCSCTTGNLEIE